MNCPAPLSTVTPTSAISQGLRSTRPQPPSDIGGGFTYDANQVVANRYVDKASTLPPIVLESTVSSTLTNTAGTIAMARTSAPDSATAGFFVNTAANAGFNSTNTRDGYAVFGGIIHGAAGWAALLDSVASTGEVTKPNTPVHLHWAYQIQ